MSPWVVFAVNDGAGSPMRGIGALAAVQVAVLARRIGRFAWWAAPGFPLLLAGFVALFVRSALHRAVRRTVSWHDRSVPVRVR